MANSSRIRTALDKTISLGACKSGTIQLDSEGAYTLRLITSLSDDSGNNSAYYVELEILYRKLVTIRSTKNGSENTFGALIDSNGILHYFLGSFFNSNNLWQPIVYVEYNLKPVSIQSDFNYNNNIPNFQNNTFYFNRTYFLDKVILSEDNNGIAAADLTVNTLEAATFSTDAATINVDDDTTIKVPDLLVETVGINTLDVNNVNAENITTDAIIIRKSTTNQNSRGWKFTSGANAAIIIEPTVQTTGE